MIRSSHRPCAPHRGAALLATAVLAVAASFFASGCIRNPATQKIHARLLSAASERKIGEETKKRILEQFRVLESTTVAAYVNDLGQKLARVSDRPTVDYDFTVLDSDLINAFAAPGGFIFVTRGLLESIDDEAELAMVLGHEISHVAALHGVQIIQKEMGQNALTILGTVGAAIVAGPEAMLMVANTADLFSSLYLLGYSREKELEADNLGLQYILRAGYDPQAALAFLEKLEEGDPEEAQGWDLYFRTHPSTKERIEIIENMVGERTEREARAQRERYQEIKALLPRVPAGERGEIKGLLYRNAVHHLSLAVPSNWALGYFHPQALIAFQTNDKKAEGRLQVVALGSSTIHADELAFRFAKDAGYQPLAGKDVLYNAGYGYLGFYVGSSATGHPMDIRLYATIRRNKGYILVCAAPINKLDSYILDIEQIMRGFRFS